MDSTISICYCNVLKSPELSSYLKRDDADQGGQWSSASTHVTKQRQKIAETLPFAFFNRGAAIQSGALRDEQFAVQIGFTILAGYFSFGFRQSGIGAGVHALVKSLHLLIQSEFERQTVPFSSFHLLHNTSMAYERSDPV
jgi:hypothetical protein